MFFRKKKSKVQEFEELEEASMEMRMEFRSMMKQLERQLKKEWEQNGEITSKGLILQWKQTKNKYLLMNTIYQQIKAKRIQAERQEFMDEKSKLLKSEKIKALFKELRKAEKAHTSNLNSIFRTIVRDLELTENDIAMSTENLDDVNNIASEYTDELTSNLEDEFLREIGIKSSKKSRHEKTKNPWE